MTIRPSAARVAALLVLAASACDRPADLPDLSVRGRVVTTEGAPLAATVWIGGASTPTAADGGFSFARVETPYDLVVVAQGRAFVYEGVGRRDPVVPLPLSGTVQQGTVTGTFSGGTYPEDPAQHRTRLSFGSPEAMSDQWHSTATDGTFSEIFRWPGEKTEAAGILRALQWKHDASSVPTQYLGFGAKAVTLSATTPITGVEVPLSPVVQVGRLQGEFVVPPGYQLLVATYHLYWPDHGELSMGAPSALTFDFATPALDGARIAVFALADGAAGELLSCRRAGLGATATGLRIQLALPPAQVSPAADAVDVGYGTPFSWFDTQPGVKVLSVRIPNAGEVVTVHTTGTSVKLPDLRPMGIALAPSTRYEWILTGRSEAGADDLLVTPLREPADTCDATGPARAFTTAATP